MVDEEQPFSLRGGGDSRINRTTKNKKLTKAEMRRIQEQKWETMLADVGLRPQDQPDLEDFSSNSSSNTSDNSSSAIGKSDSDEMSVHSNNGEDQMMDSGDGGASLWIALIIKTPQRLLTTATQRVK